MKWSAEINDSQRNNLKNNKTDKALQNCLIHSETKYTISQPKCVGGSLEQLSGREREREGKKETEKSHKRMRFIEVT